MSTRHPTTHPLRGTIRAVLAMALGAAALLSTAAIAPAAQASTHHDSITYSAQLNIPAPPSSTFAGSAGGDGWGLAFTSTAVYNVFHHDSILEVACHLQIDSSECWAAPKQITDNGGNAFASSGQPGLWMNQNDGHLYVFATRIVDNTAGVVCIDTTQPASVADPFCGFTALSAVGDSPISGSISSITDPVIVGTNWYAFNSVDGIPTGTQDTMLCFSLVTISACPSQPFAVQIGTDVPVTSGDFPSPPIISLGAEVIVPVGLSSTGVLACFDTTNGGNCAGSWPVDVTSLNYTNGSGGAGYPILNSTGAPTGFCLPVSVITCFGLDGSTAVVPPNMSTAVTEATASWNGPSLTIGARVYLPDGNGDQVDCYDYVALASCTGFPKAISNLNLLYTVNPDPLRPSCIWVNADFGNSQIQNFDAYTGGPCGQGAVRVLAASVVAPNNICVPSNYTSIQVLAPGPGQYTSGTVQFEDFNGNPIPSIPDQTLDGTGSVNLVPLNLTTKSPLPQFLITLNGAGAPPEVDVKLTWTGTASPLCTPGGQRPTAQGYRLAGADGGVFAFGQDAFYGSLTSEHLNGPIVGMASTVDNLGYWLTGADGGVFAFGDAQYYGGLGASVSLNAPIVGMAATPSGHGYWLVAADGGVFAYGDAAFYGSTGSGGATADVVGMAVTPSSHGYWLVSSDGNVYRFGDAVAHGTMFNKFLAGPITGIAATPTGGGYWLTGSDGGIFAFGNALFLGSEAGQSLVGSVTGIVPTKTGDGYWLVADDGGVFAFGAAQFLGCEANSLLNAPLWAISS